MKEITDNIKEYFYETNKRVLVLATLLTGILIFLNYHFGIDDNISAKHSFTLRFFSRYVIFLLAFGLPWLFLRNYAGEELLAKNAFSFLVAFCPCSFFIKNSDAPAHSFYR